ncbi:MinD/ParA family ATP-binding protein [Micromonospora aurantiaca]|uniref:MinD/ParA family ATP-binding protein n=1 Tax=Micromonospora aurantiaca (nom. illeg.) TaxID=47850 RepID=UPI001476C66B|nr:hypothetical protein [Micromonospora aurantiaca]
MSDPSTDPAGHLASTGTSSEVTGAGERGTLAERATLAPPAEPDQPAGHGVSLNSVGPWWASDVARGPRAIPREFSGGSQAESLWLRASSLRPGCPLVSVSSADGGVGRSTLTAALGGVLALASPAPIVAVDATARAWGGLGHRVVRGSAASAWDASVAETKLADPRTAEELMQRGPTGLRVLVGESKMTAQRRPPTWSEMFGVIGHLRSVYAMALLDLPAADNTPTWRALGWATVPVLVSRATVDALQHTMRLLAHLKAAGLDQVAESAVVVVMTTTHSTAREVRAVEQLARQAATHLVRVPFDPVLARPDPLDPRSLSKATRTALTEVAAAVVDRCPADPGPHEGASVA